MIGIIGSGPAGVSCAIYLKRANIPVIVFTNHKSSLLKAHSIENFYGVGKITGESLYQKGLEELKELDIPIYEEEVLNIEIENNFLIETSKQHYSVDKIVLATGSLKRGPEIPNLATLEGKGVSYCVTCDGFFFKEKKIAVIGSGELAIHEYEYLKNLTNDIYLLTNGEKTSYEGNKIDTPIKEILGSDKVEGILFQDDSKLNVDGIFVANTYADSNILARKIGILTNDNHILVNQSMETNIPNIYACGDATQGIKQVAKATYDGMAVALSIISKKGE